MKTLRRDGAFVSALLMSALAAALMLTAGEGHARGQQAVTYATIGGRVEDANGAALPGVNITATNIETNQSRTSQRGLVRD